MLTNKEKKCRKCGLSRTDFIVDFNPKECTGGDHDFLSEEAHKEKCEPCELGNCSFCWKGELVMYCSCTHSSNTTDWRTAEREALAEIEHNQWVEWSKSLAECEPLLTRERIERWQKLWRPYSELTEIEKDQDRKYANIVLSRLEAARKEGIRDVLDGDGIRIMIEGARAEERERILGIVEKMPRSASKEYNLALQDVLSKLDTK